MEGGSGIALLKVVTIDYILYLTVPKNLNVDPSSDKTLLVGEEYDDDYKWFNIFSHGGFIYEIPCNAKQFLKFILLTKHSN